MTVLAKSRLLNIEKSLNAYLFAHLVTGAGYTVIFPRETFGNTLPSAWIEITYIPLSDEFPVGYGAQGWGSERQLLINGNVFEQKADQIGQAGGGATQYSLPTMVDAVLDVLGPRAAIALRDYGTAGTPVVAYFGWRGGRAQRVQTVPELESWNVSVTLSYPQEFV